MEVSELKKEFERFYGHGDIRTFYSPGRINLIGEHTDYNGGLVLPCALQIGTYACVRKRSDRMINLMSTNFRLRVSVDTDYIIYNKRDEWANYPKGVIKVMKDKGYEIGGIDVLISGDIPNGAGLSSSASLELLIGVIINNLFNDGKIDKLDLVKMCQKSENTFVGVNCGIMDQFAVCMGKKDKGIMLDCSTLNYNYTDVRLKKYVLVVMDTNKRRALNESKYNERRAECEEALNAIKTKRDINFLCELSIDEFDKLKDVIEKENVRKRARHAVYENVRVRKAYKYLSQGKVEKFGKLLMESHNSLRDLYQVTGRELDTIVGEALKASGCIGARMTGAGFGGCAIALVHKNSLEEFNIKVKDEYRKEIGYEPSFYITGIGDGTCELL